MQKKCPKAISLLLVACMLLQVLTWNTAGTAGAYANEAVSEAAPTVSTIPNPDYVEPGNVRELESRREENVKHFLLPDNTVQAVVYADAVHRKDADGKWQNISNDLNLTEQKGVKFYATADDRVVFAEKFSPNAQLWQLSENGYSIAMGVVNNQLSAESTLTPAGGVTVTNAAKRSTATTWHSVEEARAVDNTASIVYSNIKANTDLEYIMTGNDIKENIVVKARASSYSYQFSITLTGLSAVLNKDGSISLTDSLTGRQQYTIPAPYMVDAAGEYSDSVTYTLKQTGEGEYTLTVTADSRWINAANREFPIKIDPSIKNLSYMDTEINSDYPDHSFADYEDIWLTENSILYFWGGLPTLPAGAEIISASLVVRYYYYDTVTTGSLRGKAYMVTQSWSDSTLTWNTALQMDNFGLWPTTPSYQDFSGSVGAYENTPGIATFNIMHAVNFWETGTPNYGIALRYYNGTNSSVIIKSYESAAQYRPYYTFTYTEPRLADGVYLLQNVGSQCYLEVRNGGYTAGTVVQQNTLTNQQNLRSQLFKITFLETVDSNNYYSIRPMTNSGMGLSAPLTGSTRYVTIDTMSTNEAYADIEPEQRWIISQNGFQYTLKNGNDAQGWYLASRFSAAGAMVETLDGVTDYTKWSLTAYTEDTRQGVVPVKHYPKIGEGITQKYEFAVFSSISGVNGPPVYSVWELDLTETDKATIDAVTGELTTFEKGIIYIKVQFVGCPNTYSFQVEICPTVHVEAYYDKAYSTTCTNYITRISTQLLKLRNLYIEDFGIWIDFSAPTQFACYACVNCTEDPTVACSHTTKEGCHDSYYASAISQIVEKELHHTNYYNIFYNSYQHSVETKFTVRYFTHNMCVSEEPYDYASDNPYCPDAQFLGLSHRNIGLIAVTNNLGEIMETSTLVHEFGHLYEAPDHYDTNNLYPRIPSTQELRATTGDDRFNENCIYGELKDTFEIQEGLVICEGCKARILDNRDNYNHMS